MLAVRLLPVFFSTLIFSAHVSRHGAQIIAIIILIILLTLFYKKEITIKIWTVYLIIMAVEWTRTMALIIMGRIQSGQDWTKIPIILGSIILFTLFSAFWINRQSIKNVYQR